MNVFRIAAAAAALGLLFGVHASAQTDRDRPARRSVRTPLDAETLEKVRTLRDAHRKETAALRAKLTESRIDLRSVLRSEAPDEQRAIAARRALDAVRAQMAESRLRHRLAVRKLLPEGGERTITDRSSARTPRFRKDRGCRCCDGPRWMERDGRRDRRPGGRGRR